MSIVAEIPFAYTVVAIPYRARMQQAIGVMARLPVRIEELDSLQAPVAVRASGVEERLGGAEPYAQRNVVLQGVPVVQSIPHEEGIAAGRVDYRLHPRGHLLAPMAVLQEGDDEASLPLLAQTLDAQLSGVERLRLSPFLELAQEPWAWMQDLQALGGRNRFVSDDRAERTRALQAVMRDAAMVDGVLHLKSPGPSWNVGPHRRTIDISEACEPDGRLCFRADHLDHALEEARRRGNGDDAGAPVHIFGSIDILMPTVFADDRHHWLLAAASDVCDDDYGEIREWSRPAVEAWLDLRDAVAQCRIGVDTDLATPLMRMARSLGVHFHALDGSAQALRLLRDMGMLENAEAEPALPAPR